MFKVDEYLRRASLARASAQTSNETMRSEYQRAAKEWDDLAQERLAFLGQMVRDRVMTWRDIEANAERTMPDAA